MERYLVTGVQLGLLIVSSSRTEKQEIVDKIINNQYINIKTRDNIFQHCRDVQKELS